MKIPLVFTFTHDSVFQGVKEESSLLAERRRDQEGNSLFEELVFDEEYLVKFRGLFFEAQAEVISVVSGYMRGVAVVASYLDVSDFSQQRDFIFTLLLPYSFNVHLVQGIDSKLREFLTGYVMYRWLELKLPQEGVVYEARAGRALEKVKGLLEVRTVGRRRRHGLF